MEEWPARVKAVGILRVKPPEMGGGYQLEIRNRYKQPPWVRPIWSKEADWKDFGLGGGW